MAEKHAFDTGPQHPARQTWRGCCGGSLRSLGCELSDRPSRWPRFPAPPAPRAPGAGRGGWRLFVPVVGTSRRLRSSSPHRRSWIGSAIARRPSSRWGRRRQPRPAPQLVAVPPPPSAVPAVAPPRRPRPWRTSRYSGTSGLSPSEAKTAALAGQRRTCGVKAGPTRIRGLPRRSQRTPRLRFTSRRSSHGTANG